MSESMEKLKARLADVNALNSATAVLDWDQQVLMPSGGAAGRAEHVSSLSRLAHEIFVADETRRLVEDCLPAVDEGSDDGAMLKVVSRDLDTKTKIPAALVAEQSRLGALGHEVWVKARAENKFGDFAPILEQTADLSRRIAECLGYADHPYDAVTDLFEEGATKKYWDAMFDSVRLPLVDLVAEISASGRQSDDGFLYGEWSDADQWAFSTMLIEAIGFDTKRGRLDTAPHPFCTTFGVGDVRLTTRWKKYLPSAIFGSLHEAGHGMYEQGTPMKWDGSPLAGGVSLGWHESQSRTWENIVGRSRPFWSHFLPKLKAQFPALGGIELGPFLSAVNKVSPSLIRVEADEVTYNLHIMVRFEVECGMISGEMAVKDIPEIWNEKYRSYLGIVPPTDSEGCLQDVHWSAGLLGYFPTYSMGNILSHQVWNRLAAEVGDVDGLMESGNFAPILDWLVAHVYSKGRSVKPQELIRQVCGGGLDAGPYLAGIGSKYREIYGI